MTATGAGRWRMNYSLAYRPGSPRSRPEPTPLSEAIDGRRVKAAAAQPVAGAPAVLAVATDQPFDEIAAGLRKRRYVRRDDLLVSPEGFSRVVFPVVADGGDGVLVLGV